MRRAFVGIGVFAIALSGVWVAACDDGSSATDGVTAPTDVILQAGATDTALEALLAAKVTQNPDQEAFFTWPSTGDAVTLSPAPTFWWAQGDSAREDHPSIEVRGRLSPTRSLHASLESPRLDLFPKLKTPLAKKGFIDVLEHDLVDLGIPSAHAASSVMTGEGFLLVISTDSDPHFIRIFTAGNSYTPDAAAVKKLSAVTGNLQAVVTSANFDNDALSKGGGPFAGSAITFTIRKSN